MMRALLPPARRLGPAVIVGLAAAWAVLWFAAEPPGQPATAYLGQFFGAESVLLLSIALVLISTLPWVEGVFDGIDRAAIWHRRVAITGMVLLVPHILLSVNPHRSRLGPLLAVIGAAGLLILAVWAILPRWRSLIPRALHRPVLAVRRLPGLRDLGKRMGGYELWRSVHRLTGLFVAAGFLHGLLDGTPFPRAQLLRWSYVAIGGIGLAFYLYRELLARHFVPLYDYQVTEVHDVGAGITEIALAPLGRPAAFAPGQFAMLYLEGIDGWHRHPFTITSASGNNLLSLRHQGAGRQHHPAPGRRTTGHARSDPRSIRPVQPPQGHQPTALDCRRHRGHSLPELAAGARGAAVARPGRLLLHLLRPRYAIRRRDKDARGRLRSGTCPLRRQPRRAPHRPAGPSQRPRETSRAVGLPMRPSQHGAQFRIGIPARGRAKP